MNNRYELVVVFDPALTDSDITTQIEKIETVVKAHGGAVEKQDLWGRRDLAYKINKTSQGFYAILVISGDNSLVSDLKRQLRISDSVMRSLIVIKDKYAPDSVRPVSDLAPMRESRSPVDVPEPPEPEIEDAIV